MSKRNMERVFLPNEDRELEVDEYFSSTDEKEVFEFRGEIERSRLSSNPIALCCECYQPVVIRGMPNKTKFFAHTKNSEDCIIKTTSHLSHEEILAMKFNGQKEGALHRALKQELATTVRSDYRFSDAVYVEKTFREENPTGIAKKWRRPDVSATYKDSCRSVVFELQISTTFIEVIINREEFYRDNGAYLFWVFASFDSDKFTTLDIAAANKSNIFVFDREAREASSKEDQLVLKCYYRVPYEVTSSMISYRWEHELVTLSELTFDDGEKKLFFKDPDVLLTEFNDEIEERKRNEKAEREAKERAEKELREAEYLRRAKLEEERKRNLQPQPYFSTRKTNTTSYANRRTRSLCIFDSKNRPNTGLAKNTVNCKCGHIGKPKKVGKIKICSNCAQPIET